MTKSTITVIGSINYDLVTYIDTIANAGETKAANSFETHYGGKGLNQAVSASKLLPADSGVKVQICGHVGDDSFGPILLEYLQREGADVRFVKTVPEESTGVAVIVVEEKLHGENRILINAGANGHLHPSEAEYAELFPEDFPGEEFVVLENETPNTLETIEWLHRHRPSVNICYNPSPFRNLDKEIYSKIDVLIVNETEALMCSENILSASELGQFRSEISQDKVVGYGKLAVKLSGNLNKANLNLCVITLGSKGALYAIGEETKFFASTVVASEKVVDTTGAGDTFLGGVVSQLSLGSSIDDAMRFASKASALTVQSKGAAEAVPHYEDVL